MENKYYTPKIEEFHVGFEFEDGTLAPMGDQDIDWSTNKVDIVNFKYILDLYKDWKHLYRVKYLDQEDIESFGFKESEEDCYISNKTYLGISTADDKKLIIINSSCHVLIYYKSKRGEEFTMFDGMIKNKSELKKVLQMIGVIEDE